MPPLFIYNGNMKITRYQVLIPCPHKEKSKHMAVLDCEGGEFPGIWACNYGYSDVHEHEDYQVEEGEVDTMRNGEHDTYPVRYYVCGLCGVEIEDASPDEDAADAIIDAQISELRERNI